MNGLGSIGRKRWHRKICVDGRVQLGCASTDVLADFLVNMSASADVLAMAKVEVDLNAIPEGKNVCFR